MTEREREREKEAEKQKPKDKKTQGELRTARVTGEFKYYTVDDMDHFPRLSGESNGIGRLLFFIPHDKKNLIKTETPQYHKHPLLEHHVKKHLSNNPELKYYEPSMGEDYWVAHTVHVLPLEVEKIDHQKLKKYKQECTTLLQRKKRSIIQRRKQ